jgi:catechol 2,3-dioxygenase-like lactoylglutathione lyase family enzyme
MVMEIVDLLEKTTDENITHQNGRREVINLLLNRSAMQQHIAQIALVVKDYDEAIEFYTRKLKFDLVEDTTLSATKRWVVVRPRGTGACAILLAKAANEEQSTRIGNQTGGRVFLFLHTTDFEDDYADMLAAGISFVRSPVDEPYGRVAVFEDLYGNLWDLIQPRTMTSLNSTKKS